MPFNEFPSNLPDSIDNAIKNISNKPSAQVGNILDSALFMVFHPLLLAADKKRLLYAKEYEKYQQELNAAYSSIPNEKRIEPSISTTARILENSKFCIEIPELRNMFVTLASKSMHADFSQYIHPSFSEMIKQMSPHDAKLLALFKSGNPYPICEYRRILAPNSFRILMENVFIENQYTDLLPNNLSIAALSYLGLLNTSYTTYIKEDRAYDKFKSHPYYKELQVQYSDETIEISPGIVSLSTLGQLFINVCVPD